jgi:rhodanese-related sulfurtransferase
MGAGQSGVGKEPDTHHAEEEVMAKTFNQMVEEAVTEVPAINAVEAHRRLEEDPETLVIDPRDAADVAATGMVAGAMNISYGALTYGADNEVPEEWRNPEFQDRSRPIIMACELGLLGPLAGKLLKDMGFTTARGAIAHQRLRRSSRPSEPLDQERRL